MEDVANPLPAIVTAEIFGVALSRITGSSRAWSENLQRCWDFQHNPGRAAAVLRSLEG